jgi:hypothetical protein
MLANQPHISLICLTLQPILHFTPNHLSSGFARDTAHNPDVQSRKVHYLSVDEIDRVARLIDEELASDSIGAELGSIRFDIGIDLLTERYVLVLDLSVVDELDASDALAGLDSWSSGHEGGEGESSDGGEELHFGGCW